MAEPIIWHNVECDIEQLKPHTSNPRTLTKKAFKKLVDNIRENGYTNRLIVDIDKTVLGGNQRLKALKELGYKEIEILMPDRPLTHSEVDRINITDNISAGEWDFDMLGNLFEPEQLIDWGMPEHMLGKSHFDLNEPEEKVKETKTKMCPHCGELL